MIVPGSRTQVDTNGHAGPSCWSLLELSKTHGNRMGMVNLETSHHASPCIRCGAHNASNVPSRIGRGHRRLRLCDACRSDLRALLTHHLAANDCEHCCSMDRKRVRIEGIDVDLCSDCVAALNKEIDNWLGHPARALPELFALRRSLRAAE